MAKEKLGTVFLFAFVFISSLLIAGILVENLSKSGDANPAYVHPTVQIVIDDSLYDQWKTPTEDSATPDSSNGTGGGGLHVSTSTPTPATGTSQNH